VQKGPWDKARNAIRSLAQIYLQIHRMQQRAGLQATPASQGGHSTTARRKAAGRAALQPWIPARRRSMPYVGRRRDLPEQTLECPPPQADELHLGSPAMQRRRSNSGQVQRRTLKRAEEGVEAAAEPPSPPRPVREGAAASATKPPNFPATMAGQEQRMGSISTRQVNGS
jgi:hypothetical protein